MYSTYLNGILITCIDLVDVINMHCMRSDSFPVRVRVNGKGKVRVIKMVK